MYSEKEPVKSQSGPSLDSKNAASVCWTHGYCLKCSISGLVWSGDADTTSSRVTFKPSSCTNPSFCRPIIKLPGCRASPEAKERTGQVNPNARGSRIYHDELAPRKRSLEASSDVRVLHSALPHKPSLIPWAADLCA